MTVNDLTYSGIVDKSKVENIIISLNPFEILFVNIHLSHSNFITRTAFTPQTNRKSKLTFSSFSVRKFNSIHNKCISDEDLSKFGEDYFDFIVDDCYFKSLNESYGCIFLTDKTVYFDRYIYNGSKFCENSNVTIDSLKKTFAKCVKRSKPKCNSINFNSKIETTKLLSNETILEFIPQKTPRIGYTETYKTDFDRLIYNCGGVLGLWFGLTPNKLVDIFKYLPLISKVLISKTIKFGHHLKVISIRFAQNLIIICKRFGLYLLGFCVRFVQNLIRICKRFGLYLLGICFRFVQNLIRICKRFGLLLIANIITFAYNLIAIFMRFVHHLFRMISTEN
jgi:hypothetical protein